MKKNTSDNEKKLSKPKIYKIKVQGELSADWSDRLAGMQITIERRKNRKPISVLKGSLDGQAALASVLNALYELHLSIVSVEKITIGT